MIRVESILRVLFEVEKAAEDIVVAVPIRVQGTEDFWEFIGAKTTGNCEGNTARTTSQRHLNT